MATLGARTAALAAVIAGGTLCEGLISQPAQANVLAFENTGSAPDAILELFNAAGDNVATVTTYNAQGYNAQGSIPDSNSVPLGVGGAAGGSTSYAAGLFNGSPLADYFIFDLAGVTDQTVYSAELIIYSGTITNNLTLNLTGLTDSTIAGLSDNQAPPDNETLYQGLVGTSFGSFALSPGESGETLTFTFTNATPTGMAFLAAINADTDGDNLGIGGNVSLPSSPEPSTWIMMLAGFAGLGLIARRRAAKRRAAAAR